MDRINKEPVKTQASLAARRAYALRRMMIAMDRVIAGNKKEQRRKDVAWASLWHKHWKSLSIDTKPARGGSSEQFTQAGVAG